MNSTKKNINIFFILLVGLIFLSGLYTILRKEKDISLVENRNLTKFSHFTYSSFLDGSYQTNLENAMIDQFVGSEWIKENSKKFQWNSILAIKKKICSNNYYRLADDKYNYNCGDYMVFKPVKESEEIKKRIHNNMKYYHHLNQKMDTYYYFVTTSCVYDFQKNSFSLDIPSFIKSCVKHYD